MISCVGPIAAGLVLAVTAQEADILKATGWRIVGVQLFDVQGGY